MSKRRMMSPPQTWDTLARILEVLSKTDSSIDDDLHGLYATVGKNSQFLNEQVPAAEWAKIERDLLKLIDRMREAVRTHVVGESKGCNASPLSAI